ncbi:hypothetical protein [Paenibacillus lautus]|uniref:hypothetical protein n=1 Tax=Paenibacillus lautus TaxID=1401 RepID=UPI003D2AADE9
MKKTILTISAALLLTTGVGVASAAPIKSPTTPTTTADFSTQASWTVTLKVGETYQLPYGKNYMYSAFPSNVVNVYFKVSSTGLVTALKAPFGLRPGEAVGAVGVWVNGGSDIGEFPIVITD